MPIQSIDNRSSIIGKAHNLILDKCLNEKIGDSNLDGFYVSASEVLQQIPQLNKWIIEDAKFKFAMLYTLEKISEGYSIKLNPENSEFIQRTSEIDNRISSGDVHDEIIRIRHATFQPTKDFIELQNRDQMAAIGFFTHHYWNKQ